MSETPSPSPTDPEGYARWSGNVLEEILAKYKLDDADALIAHAKTLDDGNRYLKREELEAAAKTLQEKHERGVAGYRYSENVLAKILAKYGLTDADLLLHEATSYDADHNRYLKTDELDAAAQAMSRRSKLFAGHRWSEKVLSEVAAAAGVSDPRTVVLEAIANDERDRYYSREELEAAAAALSKTAADSPWRALERFWTRFAFMVRPGASDEEIASWEAAQGVTLPDAVRALVADRSCVEIPSVESPNFSAESTLLPLAEWVRLDRSGPGQEGPELPTLIGVADAKLEDFVLIGEDPLGVDYGFYVVLHPSSGQVYGLEISAPSVTPLGSMGEWIAELRMPDIDSGDAYPDHFRTVWESLTGESGTAASLGSEYLSRVENTFTRGRRAERWEASFDQFELAFDGPRDAKSDAPKSKILSGSWGRLQSFWGPFGFMIRPGASKKEIREWEQAQGVSLGRKVRGLVAKASCVEIPSIESPSFAPEATLLPLSEWVRLDRSLVAKENPDLADMFHIPPDTLSFLILIGEDPLGVDTGYYVVMTAIGIVYSLKIGEDSRYLGNMDDWLASSRMPGLDGGASYPALFREKWKAFTGEPGTVDALSEEYLNRVSNTLTAGKRAERWKATLDQFRTTFDGL